MHIWPTPKTLLYNSCCKIYSALKHLFGKPHGLVIFLGQLVISKNLSVIYAARCQSMRDLVSCAPRLKAVTNLNVDIPATEMAYKIIKSIYKYMGFRVSVRTHRTTLVQSDIECSHAFYLCLPSHFCLLLKCWWEIIYTSSL